MTKPEIVKVSENYFFSVGIVSIVTAFFLLSQSFLMYYFLIFFYALNFSISFLLSISMTKKIKDVYIMDTKKYIILHLLITVITSIITITSLVYFEQTVSFMSYFVGINFFIMFALLAKIIISSFKY